MRRLSPVLASLLLAVLVSIVLAFSTQWSTHFDGGNADLNQWDRHNVGACSGQSHSVSGSSVHMRAADNTECFGAYYRENAGHPGTFPTDQDVRVIWRWRYPEWGWFGTQAGQLTGRYGWPQYYGVSGVDMSTTSYAHVEAYGPWGHWDVDNPIWKTNGTDTGWHTSVFDFICDGTQLTWFVDGNQVKYRTGSAIPAGHNDRPYQFWFGNLLDDVGPEPGKDDWTGFDIDFVYIYAVERPVMNTPSPGGGGTQPVDWNPVPNTQLPDGDTPVIEYQVRCCTDPNCANMVVTSPWQVGTNYTFTGLEVNRTYYYQARARWVTQPTLNTCWSPTVPANMPGEPDISLAKSATAEAGPGETIQYTLVVQNPGQGTATGVVVRDPIPQYVVNPTNISGGGSAQGDEIVWNVGTLNAGASRTLTWQGTVDPAIPVNVTEILNVAMATDDSGHSDQAQATTSILIPGIDLEKTAPAELKPGETFIYTITVANTGNTTLHGVVVRDPIPQYITSPNDVSHGGAVQGVEIVWDVGDMTPGDSLVLTWRGTVDPAIPVEVTEILNQATVTTSSGVGDQDDATSVVQAPEMGVIKLATTPVMPGDIIDYQIQVENRGNTLLYQVRVEDVLPPFVIPVSISDGGYRIPGGIAWENIGDIPVGESRVVTWQGQVDPLIPTGITELLNVAVASTSGLTETGEALTEVLPPGLELEKDASATAYAGGEIAYVLRLINNGPGLARFIVVRDPVPEYTWYVPDVSPTTYHYGVLEGDEVVWRLNELGPGESTTLRWRAQVDVDVPPGVEIIPNLALATSLDNPDPITATAETRLLDPGLQVSKTCLDFAQAGDVFTYQLHIENAGTGTVRNALVREPLPDGMSYVLASATHNGRLVGDELVWDLGTVASGDELDLAFALKSAPDLDADSVTSTSYLFSADEAVAQRGCQTALAVPTLAITKTAPAGAVANDVVEYTITVENTGPVVARNAILVDTLPSGADYVPGSASDGGQVADGVITWLLGDLATGDQVERRFQVQVHAPQGVDDAQIYNDAVVSADRTVAVRDDTITLVPRPQLHLVKTATAEVMPGEVVDYTLVGGNYGPGLARQAVLEDKVPEGIIVLEDTIGDGGYYLADRHVVVWPVGDLPEGATLERSFRALVPITTRPGGDGLENLAFIDSPDAAPASARASTIVTGTFEVVGLKLATEYAEPGARIDYAIQVHNGSPNVVDNVVIRDPLPEYTSYITDTASLPPAFEDGGRTLAWNVGVMAPGETYEVRFAVQVDEEVPDWLDRVVDVAEVSYSGGSFEVRATTMLPGAQLELQAEPAPAPPTPEPCCPDCDPPAETTPPRQSLVANAPTVPPTSTPEPALSEAEGPLPGPELHKSVTPATVETGQVSTVTWTLTFTNPTPLLISGVTVRDPLPVGLAYLDSSNTQGHVEITGDPSPGSGLSLTRTVIVAHLGDVEGNGRAEIIIRTLVLSDTEGGTVYTNTASYSALNVDPGISNEAVVVVEGAAILPVTGGLLDPRTPQGKLMWTGFVALVLPGTALVFLRRRRGGIR